MAMQETPTFDAPIHGESLTHELGARPWQSPPQYATVEERTGFLYPTLCQRRSCKTTARRIEYGRTCHHIG